MTTRILRAMWAMEPSTTTEIARSIDVDVNIVGMRLRDMAKRDLVVHGKTLPGGRRPWHLGPAGELRVEGYARREAQREVDSYAGDQ